MTLLEGHLAARHHATVMLTTTDNDDGYFISVRVNKVVNAYSDAEEVVGRDRGLEEAILKHLNALPVQEDGLDSGSA